MREKADEVSQKEKLISRLKQDLEEKCGQIQRLESEMRKFKAIQDEKDG